MSHCSSAVNIIQKHLDSKTYVDPEHPGAELVALILDIAWAAPVGYFKFRWMLSHLDDLAKE